MESISLFLSAAEEDGETGNEIYQFLTGQGFRVYYWQDRQGGGLFIEDIERAIIEADAFILLVSPHYLASNWCNCERELAMLREFDLRAEESGRVFTNVLRIADTPYARTGFLRRYAWTDLTNPDTKDTELARLAQNLKAISPAPKSGDTILGEVGSLFRNRLDELEKVSRGITNAAGPHFWLITAPPQLGKTWFLNRLSVVVANEQMAQGDDARPWVIRMVDIRQQPPEVRENHAAILSLLFGHSDPGAANGDAYGIAGAICQSGKPHMCLLDGAELLSEETASDLRGALSSIYRSVQGSGMPDDVRLAVVVASRREHHWSGISPEPRLSVLPLTEFQPDIVQGALRDLARQMHRRNFSPADYQQSAVYVYRLSEGLPALLLRCLQWIQSHQWVNIERLDMPSVFEEIAHRYIKDDLLSFGSLFPRSREQPRRATSEMQRDVLDRAFRVLAPYRLITQSHLRHYLDADEDFSAALREAEWQLEDLWQAISNTALLKSALREVWQELHEAIRRLLFRYYYSSPADRAEAHREAREFMQVWVDKQAGKEQVVGQVECLWHEASELRLRNSADTERILIESARKLSDTLPESSAYSMGELRSYAANLIRNDEDLQEALGHMEGLADRLAAIVAASQ